MSHPIAGAPEWTAPQAGGTSSGWSAGARSAGAQGRTQIAGTVVSKIAGVAARDVPGVHQLGGGAARALGALRERMPGAITDAGQGVSVEVGERQAAIDLHVVVEYGIPIAELAKAVRRTVIAAVESMTGLDVVEVDIVVVDVHLPEDGSDQFGGRRSEPRVL